jgi:hypothetical protein
VLKENSLLRKQLIISDHRIRTGGTSALRRAVERKQQQEEATSRVHYKLAGQEDKKIALSKYLQP